MAAQRNDTPAVGSRHAELRLLLMRLLLLLAWFAFMASSVYWLPGYEGDVGGEETQFLPVYAVLAGLAAVAVRRRAQSQREARSWLSPQLRPEPRW